MNNSDAKLLVIDSYGNLPKSFSGRLAEELETANVLGDFTFIAAGPRDKDIICREKIATEGDAEFLIRLFDLASQSVTTSWCKTNHGFEVCIPTVNGFKPDEDSPVRHRMAEISACVDAALEPH